MENRTSNSLFAANTAAAEQIRQASRNPLWSPAMTKERYVHELSRYGTVYEVIGIAAPNAEQRDAFRRDLMEWLSRQGFIASATSDNRCIQVFVVPHDNWPELDLEWCDEGQLLLCDTGPSSRPALPHFIEFLGVRGWSLRIIRSRSEPLR